MNVLSLFDGMSCGRIALERAGIPVTNYYASEIDKYAMKVSAANYPDIIQVGNVQHLSRWSLEFCHHVDKIDLLIGGSPCQGFSFAGKQLNFNDPRSKLFFDFVRLKEELKPKYFLLENVGMKKEYQDVISEFMGCKPITINSNLVSAQNRKRLYWTNIPGVEQPKDKGIVLKDIVHERTGNEVVLVEGDVPLNVAQSASGRMLSNLKTPKEKGNCLLATSHKGLQANGMSNIFEELTQYIVPFDKTLQILDKEVERGKVGYFRKDSQANRVYYIHDKAVTLCGDAGGGAAKMGQYLFGCITPDRIDKKQNGQRFNEGTKFYTLTAQDKHGILVEGYIRKLTPIECERLQTVPDNYTNHVSNSQRYKMLGNGWTVDVIAHIFKGLKNSYLQNTKTTNTKVTS